MVPRLFLLLKELSALDEEFDVAPRACMESITTP